MPETSPAGPLEWNEENLSRVISDLYRDAESDGALHDRLMTDPFEVLSTRIMIPEEYRGGVFAREKNKRTMVMYVPARGTARNVLPEGTTEAEPQRDYEITCTVIPPW